MRMTSGDLRPELRNPQVKGVAVAFLDLIAWRNRMVVELRAHTGERGLTLQDTNVLLHVFVFGLTGGPGSRPQEIIDNLGAPRRTVRDALAMLERRGLIVREQGLYYPTGETAQLFNERYEARYRLIAKLCDAFADYQRALRR